MNEKCAAYVVNLVERSSHVLLCVRGLLILGI